MCVNLRRYVSAPEAARMTPAELHAAILAGFMHALASAQCVRTHLRREYEVGIMTNAGVPG